MAAQERNKTKYPGVFYILGTAAISGREEKIFGSSVNIVLENRQQNSNLLKVSIILLFSKMRIAPRQRNTMSL